MRIVQGLNLALLVLFPIAWFAPLMRSHTVLWFFGGTEISVVTGIQSIWSDHTVLALTVTFLAFFAPYLKTIGLSLIHFNLMSVRLLPVLGWLGKLATAEIFLIALYVVVYNAAGKVDTAWGFYLLTGCVLASLVVSGMTKPR